MSDEFWNITLRLGSWSGQVSMPKSRFTTAQEAINQAMHDIIAANANRKVEAGKEKSHLITCAEGQCVLCEEWGYNDVCWATKGGGIICACCEEPTKNFDEVQEMEASQ